MWRVLGAGVLVLIGYLSWRYQYQNTGSSPKTSQDQDDWLTDITARAERGELDPVIGREEEIDRMVHVLMRRTKNNPLLLGEPGVGKSAIVEGLAQQMADGHVPEGLQGKRLLSLDVAGLVSNTSYRGELEKNLKGLLERLESQDEQIILFIDEIHMLQQLNKAEGSLNISDVIKPALARGDLQLVGATTWQEYEEYIQVDAALDRRLQPVLVDEPTQEQALAMLERLRPVYEKYHGVRISKQAIEAAVRISDEQIEHRYLPDKAIDLMDEAAAKVAIETARPHRAAMGMVHAAAKEQDEKVGVQDIRDVADQWLIHSAEEAKRDARQDD